MVGKDFHGRSVLVDSPYIRDSDDRSPRRDYFGDKSRIKSLDNVAAFVRERTGGVPDFAVLPRAAFKIAETSQIFCEICRRGGKSVRKESRKDRNRFQRRKRDGYGKQNKSQKSVEYFSVRSYTAAADGSMDGIGGCRFSQS